ncbi:MAG: nucleotidyltransferase domain-containing protein [Candidatus Melainabacteria bacterium]|jgi:hypothetical protein|nr:nucleotidyltransferase domain-containing protein [Candidatus Melainabacteria bacterium]
MFGLPEETIQQINHCLASFPQLKWVKIYGSRAMGSYHAGSDIDLAFSSTEDISKQLLASLDALSTPYLFDVTYYDNLTHEGLKAHIDTLGQSLTLLYG